MTETVRVLYLETMQLKEKPIARLKKGGYVYVTENKVGWTNNPALRYNPNSPYDNGKALLLINCGPRMKCQAVAESVADLFAKEDWHAEFAANPYAVGAEWYGNTVHNAMLLAARWNGGLSQAAYNAQTKRAEIHKMFRHQQKAFAG